MGKRVQIRVELCEIHTKCNFVAPQKLTHRGRKCHLQSLGARLGEREAGGSGNGERQWVMLEKPPNEHKSAGFAKH